MVAITAYDDENTRSRCLAEGMFAVLSKPTGFDPLQGLFSKIGLVHALTNA